VADRPDAAVERARINSETAQIEFAALQRFFAQGLVIAVSPTLDLVEVAFQLQQDNRQQFETWLADDVVGPLSDPQAAAWLAAEQRVWSVVVRPWVLVQPVSAD
jgi:hypothetical protein